MDEVKLNIYDIEETHPNCTVQIWKNSVTGEKSVGWKDNTSFTCFRCGEKLWWECDYSYKDYDMDGDGIVTIYQCSKRGAWYEVGMPENAESTPAKRILDVDKFVSDTKEKYCGACNDCNGLKCDICWVHDMLEEIEKAVTNDG